MTRIVHVVDAPGAPPPSGPYAQMTLYGGLCFVSCQLAVDPVTGSLVDGGFDAQAAQALDNVAAILESVGLAWPDTVSATVLLADRADGSAFNKQYETRFDPGGPYPARSIYQAGALAPGALVGVAVVAAAGSPS